MQRSCRRTGLGIRSLLQVSRPGVIRAGPAGRGGRCQAWERCLIWRSKDSSHQFYAECANGWWLALKWTVLGGPAFRSLSLQHKVNSRFLLNPHWTEEWLSPGPAGEHFLRTGTPGVWWAHEEAASGFVPASSRLHREGTGAGRSTPLPRLRRRLQVFPAALRGLAGFRSHRMRTGVVSVPCVLEVDNLVFCICLKKCE